MSIEVIYQGLTIATGPKFRLQDGGVFLEVDGPMPVATPLSLVHGEHTLAGRVKRVAEGTGAGMLVVPTQTSKLPRWLLALGPLSVANVELEPEPVVAVKPEPKAEPKAEGKAEHKAEGKAGHKGAKGEHKGEHKGEREAKAEPKGEAKAEPKADAKAEGEAKAEHKTDAKAEHKTDAKAEHKADAKAEPAAEAASATEATAEAGEPAASGNTPSDPEGAGKDEDDEHAAKPGDKKAPTAAQNGAKKKKGRKR